MKTTLNTSAIARALKSDQNAAWSWNGARALAEYLEELEESTGEEMELDVCAIRCDFSEFSSLEAWAADYFRNQADAVDKLCLTLGMDGSIDEDSEEIDDLIRSFIRDNGTLIEFDGGVIVSCF
jgi:flavin-dependent dehydrogenase